MGRGQAWGQGDLGILKAYIRANKGPKHIQGQHPEWPLPSIKKAVPKMKAGKEMNQYKGRPSAISGDAATTVASAVENRSLAQIQRQLSDQGVATNMAAVYGHLRSKVKERSVKKVKTFRLTTRNVERRKEWCLRMLDMLKLGGSKLRVAGRRPRGVSLDHVVWSDEKLFHQEGKRSAWVSCYGPSKRQQLASGSTELRFADVKSKGLMVSVGVSKATGIIGPFFVEANVKINGASYIQMLEDQFVPELVRYEKMLHEGLWLEDNAPAHKSGEVLL